MTKYHLKRKKIFIAGHGGMVGSSLVNFFKNKGFNNLILVSKKKLNLLDEKMVDKSIKKP